jgi:hypothetical protein
MKEQTNAVWFCGDPHGAFEHIIQAVHEHRPAAVILLGDMDSARPLDVELAEIEGATAVYYIPGNHDTDTDRAYDNMAGSSFVSLHGRVLDIAGLRIAGLGGVFRSRAWNPRDDPAWDPKRTPDAFMATLGKGNLWRRGMPLRHRSTIFPSEVYALAQQRADVLVTHEAPHHHDLGFEALTKLATAMHVKNAYHGHHHNDIVYPDGIWRGVGLQGITSSTGDIIVHGAFDE